ncbi:DNA-binding transcriptional regulator, AcrR family [Salinihabitans flavidus]|uniref:DNA-binding transcriptional regulator, AcrR family n=1 Tax=Salinihabitans flavidus TaxID=569882 RepID=A0A1H8RKW3_9RHOB|nr:TetR/AcrR family transcriptional regulator [Salinihabitans flavidus]SEO67050.1 DNA-binding transcriptional regulator, AcrR family [Salinihabitans flavidus]
MGKREEKATATREAIFRAAAIIVGRHGYAKASIARIAEEAGVSHGLIYQYFRDQQDLFDRLLPHVGEEMLRHIAQRAGRSETVEERERLGLEANFEYLIDHPELHRILNEAAFFAPQAHRNYLKRMAEGYKRSLEKGHATGQIEAYAPEEFQTLALMFIGAREYLLEHYAVEGHSIKKLPVEVERTYLKAVALAMGVDPTRMMPQQEAGDETCSG